MACDRKYLTVIWRIENYNFSQSSLQSPSFVVDSVKNNPWFFEITPKSVLRKDHIAFHVQKKVGDAFGICFRASFFTDDSSSSLYEGYFGINPNTVFSSACYVPHSQVYARKRGKFLPPKTLTIRCEMYQTKGSFSEAGLCFARTRIRVVKTAFIAFLEEFSSLTPDDPKTLDIKSSSTDKELFMLDLYLGGEFCCKEKIWIEITSENEDYMNYAICELFLIDSKGTKTECGRNEIAFGEAEPQDWKFSLYFTRGHLMRKSADFLPDDTLTLKCEIAYSAGIEYEGIEDSELGNHAFVDKNQSKFSSALEDFTCLYEEGILCDILLQTKTETFAAHKIVLVARSSVFRSMFTIDMKEKKTDHVVIEDLDADTVRRLLLYLYSDKLKYLDWEKATSLYFAADKYNIISLKHKCSDFLMSRLEPSNCCELLLLADRHQDGNLMGQVLECITDYREEIFRSDQWMNFEKNNPELSIKTLHAVYLGN